MSKPKSDTEKVIGVIAALILLPLAIYTLWSAWQSWHDGDRFRQAEPYAESSRVVGGFYRHQGIPVLTLSQPEAFPEIKQATQYKVDDQFFLDGEWTNQGKPRLAKKQKVVVIQSADQERAQVAPDSATLYSWPTVTFEKPGARDHRLLVRYRPLLPPGSTEWVVYGTYRQGRLQDSDWHRLTITVPAEEAAILELIEHTGQIKALVHLGIAVVLAGLSFFALRGIKKTAGNVEEIS